MPAILTPKIRKPQTGGGRRGPTDFRGYGGDGGGGRGDGAPNYGERLRRYRFGMALALVAVVLLFLSVSAAFMLREQLGTFDPTTGAYVRDWRPISLPIGLLLINTVVLLLSSVTLELARRQAVERAVLAPVIAMPGISAGPRRPTPWLAISVVLGVAFLAGQLQAWRVLVSRGLDLSTTPSSSFFYVLTGIHAIHLAGGLLALLYAGLMTKVLSKSLETRRIVVDVVAWYWHVMTALWVYVFALLALGA